MSNKTDSGKFEIVVSYNGSEKPIEVNPNQAVRAVLEHSLKLFGISSNQHVMALFFTDNREITDLAKSVADWGIEAATKLVLRQSTLLAG
jgi:hypothetical protein